MLYVIVVSSQDEFWNAAKASLALREEISPERLCRVQLPVTEDAVHGFRFAEERIAELLQQKDMVHDRFVGILDFSQTCAGPITCAGNIPLRTSQGALILAFPEIQWVPIYGQWKADADAVGGDMTWRRAIELCNNGYSPLFDGDGLRSCLMMRVHKEGYSRADVALAVDEEANFAQMNAYMAYRFGYRAYSISSRAIAETLLRRHSRELPVATTLLNVELTDLEEYRKKLLNPVTIVFEDIQLQFSDERRDEKTPKFGAARDGEWSLLREADLRVVATAAREGEKIAESPDGGRETAEEHFRGKAHGRRGRYLSLQSGGAEWPEKCVRQLKEHLGRMWFNMGGAWIGHWLVNVLDAIAIGGGLIGVFFWKVSLLLPTLFGIFVLRGLLRHGLQQLSMRKGILPGNVRMYLLRRAQWRFLPKRYRNHCPESRIVCDQCVDTYWTVTHKPLAGIFGLRNECCLPIKGTI